eukprot:6871218-Prymnesium_polylepis.1
MACQRRPEDIVASRLAVFEHVPIGAPASNVQVDLSLLAAASLPKLAVGVAVELGRGVRP